MKTRGYYSRNRVVVDFTGVESMVEESHGDQTDVNEIVRRFHRTGYLPPARPVQFLDTTGLRAESLQERIQFVRDMMQEVPEFEAEYQRRLAAHEAAQQPVVKSEAKVADQAQ